MYKIKRGVLQLMLLMVMPLTITSCLVTKEYKVPEIEAEHSLFRLDSLDRTGKEVGELEWKAFFKDPILVKYIDSALMYNADNTIAFLNLEKFDAQYKQGKRGQLPSFDIAASAQRQEQAGNSQFGSFFSEPFTQYDINGRLSWEVDIWGKINSQKLASEARFKRSITAQKAIQIQLISNLSTTYFRLMEADARHELLFQTVLLRQRNLDVLKALKESGQGNSLGLAQAEGQLYQAQIMLTNVKNEIFDLENAITLLIGKNVGEIERSTLNQQSFPVEIALGIPYQVLSNRPDVKEAELEFRSLFEEHNVAKASMYPTLRITATGGFQSLALSSWLSPSSLFNTLTAGITQPVFNNRRLRTQKEVSRLDMEQSLIRFQQKVLSASVEVSNALKDLETVTNNLAQLRQQEELLVESYENSQLLLQSGLVNYLEVLNAQESLLNAQLMRIQTRSQQLQNSVIVYRSVGGGTK